MQDRIRLVLIYGSVREERFCDQVVAWAREQFDEQGQLSEPRPANSALAHTLVQLNWWAQTLRAGRERVPYERIRG